MHTMLPESGSSPRSYLDRVAYFEAKLKFDPLTYEHSRNVANLSVQLLKYSAYALDATIIYYAGLFHDIGKSLAPLEILNKETPLSSDEFSLLKEHAKLGFRILHPYEFPSEILFSALLHHEKYDGSGYPIGFKGIEIPTAARIVSICDVFDALTSDRPYRISYSDHEALEIMENSKGQFDSKLLQLFISGFRDNKIQKGPVQILK